MAKNDFDHAITDYTDAIRLDSKVGETPTDLRGVAYAIWQHRKGDRRLTEAIRLNPNTVAFEQRATPMGDKLGETEKGCMILEAAKRLYKPGQENEIAPDDVNAVHIRFHRRIFCTISVASRCLNEALFLGNFRFWLREIESLLPLVFGPNLRQLFPFFGGTVGVVHRSHSNAQFDQAYS